MNATNHDGSVCPNCGGLLEVTTEDQGEEVTTIRRAKCETCGHVEVGYF